MHYELWIVRAGRGYLFPILRDPEHAPPRELGRTRMLARVSFEAGVLELERLVERCWLRFQAQMRQEKPARRHQNGRFRAQKGQKGPVSRWCVGLLAPDPRD